MHSTPALAWLLRWPMVCHMFGQLRPGSNAMPLHALEAVQVEVHDDSAGHLGCCSERLHGGARIDVLTQGSIGRATESEWFKLTTFLQPGAAGVLLNLFASAHAHAGHRNYKHAVIVHRLRTELWRMSNEMPECI